MDSTPVVAVFGLLLISLTLFITPVDIEDPMMDISDYEDLRAARKGTPTQLTCRGALHEYPRVMAVIVFACWCKLLLD
jgi:hypothetical protein